MPITKQNRNNHEKDNSFYASDPITRSKLYKIDSKVEITNDVIAEIFYKISKLDSIVSLIWHFNLEYKNVNKKNQQNKKA